MPLGRAGAALDLLPDARRLGEAGVCVAGACTPMCKSSAACGPRELCTAGYCVPQLCGESVQCGSELSCQAGACAPPSGALAACLLAPAQQLLHDGEPGAQLAVIARDASGAVLPEPHATFTAQGAVRIDATGLPSGAGAGAGSIEARVGSVACAAQTTSFVAPPAGTLRAVVIDQSTGHPLFGAVVGLDDLSTQAVTDAAGVALLPLGAPGAHDLHAFHSGFAFTSFVATSATDLLVPLEPEALVMRRGSLTGRITAEDFARLPNPGAGVQAALLGASQAGGPFDLSFDGLFSRISIAQISMGGRTAARYSLPRYV